QRRHRLAAVGVATARQRHGPTPPRRARALLVREGGVAVAVDRHRADGGSAGTRSGPGADRRIGSPGLLRRRHRERRPPPELGPAADDPPGRTLPAPRGRPGLTWSTGPQWAG